MACCYYRIQVTAYEEIRFDSLREEHVWLLLLVPHGCRGILNHRKDRYPTYKDFAFAKATNADGIRSDMVLKRLWHDGYRIHPSLGHSIAPTSTAGYFDHFDWNTRISPAPHSKTEAKVVAIGNWSVLLYTQKIRENRAASPCHLDDEIWIKPVSVTMVRGSKRQITHFNAGRHEFFHWLLFIQTDFHIVLSPSLTVLVLVDVARSLMDQTYQPVLLVLAGPYNLLPFNHIPRETTGPLRRPSGITARTQSPYPYKNRFSASCSDHTRNGHIHATLSSPSYFVPKAFNGFDQ